MAVAIVGLAAGGHAPRTADAQQSAAPSCGPHGDIYACTLPTIGIRTPMTFTQILDALKATGVKVTAKDPAMWVTAWGAAGSNGARCGGCLYDGGGGQAGGWAQTAISPATYEATYGSDALYYSKGLTGQRGSGDSAEGGFGGGGTVVVASPPAVSSPAQPPPFWEVVVVAGGGGGGGGGGTEHTGRGGGHGGYPTASTFTRAASSAGAPGGGAGGGHGGNENGAGSGGNGGCSPAWCDGADGVGGFGGFGQQGGTDASSALYDARLRPGLHYEAVDTYVLATVQTPGMGGGGAHQPDITQIHDHCTGAVNTNYLACGGGGGGGYGGGGAGDYLTTIGDGGEGGGGGGSYAATGTCDATGAPSVSVQKSDGAVIVYVDPDQDCTSSLGAKPSTGTAEAQGPAASPRLARLLRPRDGAIGRRAVWRAAIRLRPRARIVTARLNGRPVTGRLRRSGQRTWRATFRPRHGVRIGGNTLVVTSRRGRQRHHATLHFIRAAGRRARLVDTDLVRDAGARRLRIRHRRRAGVLTRVAVGGRRVRAGHIGRDGRIQLVRLSASSGLRHGANRVVVRAHTEDGELQRAQHTVRIARDRPLAGAGPDRRAHMHARVELDGSRSLAPRGQRGLSHRWSIATAPRGSRARLAGADGATPELRPDAPGTYLVRLRVTARNGRSSTDTAAVTADALPNTQIDTLAAGPTGAPGVQLDSAWFCPGSATDTSCLFHANPAGDDSQVQVLVLDRDTLELVSNTSYSPSSLASLDKAIAEMVVTDGDTDRPDTNKLVVIALGSGAVTDVTNFSAAVSQIGMPAYGSSVTSIAGPFSIIGIPGMTTGQAWNNFGQEIAGGAAGTLNGYIKDSAYYTDSGVLETEQRVFTFPDVVGYETRVVDGSNVEVRLSTYNPSDRSYSTTTLASFPTTGGGLGVVNFDPYTLELLSATHWIPDTPSIDWLAGGEQLQTAVREGVGVIIVSLGQVSGWSSEATGSDFTGRVLPSIRSLGGQPDIFARAVNDNVPYSFISSGGQGAESSAAVVAGVPARGGPDGVTPLPVTAGNLTGELRRGPDGKFVPSKADPTGLTSPQLHPVLYQAPTDWPDTPGAGATAATGTEIAFAWLAQCRLLAGDVPVVPGIALWDGQDCDTDTDGTAQVTGTPDAAAVREVALSLRADYYDNLNLTLNDIGALTYAGLFGAGNAIFSQSEFTAAQTQVGAEAGELAAAKAFFATMATEISSSQASLTNAMTQVATTVQQAYFNQQQSITVTDYGGWAQGLFSDFVMAGATVAELYAAPEFGVEELFLTGELFSEGGDGFGLAVNGPQTSEFTDIEAWLVLDEQLQNDNASVDQAVIDSVSLQEQGFAINQDAVLSDPGRLATVAANAQNIWSTSADDLAEAANAFVIATRQQIWEGYANKLWSAGYVPYTGTRANAAVYECVTGSGDAVYPFIQAVEAGFPTGLGHGVQYWPVQAIATASTTNNAPTWTPYAIWESGSITAAPAAAVGAIFEQPAGLNSSASSAGAYGPWFWAEVFDLTRQLNGKCTGGEIETAGGNFYGQSTPEPVISGVQMTNRRFAPALRGTAFRFQLSEPARIDATVSRALPGRRLGSRCVRPGPGLGRTCTRYELVDRLSRPSARSGAGRNRIRYAGGTLEPGRYRATLRATDADGNRSEPSFITFTVLRP